MADPLFELFDDYAVRYARGEFPDPAEYLDRAGAEADKLAQMLDHFLLWAPPPEPHEDTVGMMGAWLAGDPPLRQLRVRRGLRVEEVVEALAEGLDIGLANRSKLRRYFQQLERGSLDPGRIDRRVFDSLASILETSRSLLLAWTAPPRGDSFAIAPARAYRAEREPTRAPGRPPVPDAVWDEVDRLFIGEPPT